MPAKRVLISIDERVLSRIDDAARRNGLTRSRFLAQAAIAQIEGGGEGARGDATTAGTEAPNPIRSNSDDK